MKFLVLALLVLSLNSHKASAADNFLTASTSAVSQGLGDCFTQSFNDMECEFAYSIVSGLSSTTLLTLSFLKEEIKNVDQDAYNYLAGEPMTLALEELINKVHSESEELKDASDKEIVATLINIK